MDSVYYRFSNAAGDCYAVEISRLTDGFLGDETLKYLNDKKLELWNIILVREGWREKVTPVRLLLEISTAIANFYQLHKNVILCFQCDDIEDVPMSRTKRANGITVQKYRSVLFSNMFERYAEKHELPLVNYPIYFEACGNDVYIHLLTHECNIDAINVIKADVMQCFSK